MTLIELNSAASVDEFISKQKNAVVTFSAHWCGPCKASKPALEQLARKYSSDYSKDVKVGIVYENELGDSIHKYNIRAFPTYVLFQNYGTEVNRVQGANIPGVEEMIERADGITKSFSGGEALGGGSVIMSPEEARKARLLKLGAATNANNDFAGMDTNLTNEVKVASSMDESSTQPMDTLEHLNEKGNADDESDNLNKDTMEVDPESNADPTATLNPDYIAILTEEMGFTLLRAQKGLLNGAGNNVEGAVEWLTLHQDDEDIDDPIPKIQSEVAQSYRCNECGKVLSNLANLELHANKTGHSDFEESTELVKPLTEEEKTAKIAEIKQLLKVKRAEREDKEQKEEIEREKQRRFMGKEMLKTKEQLDAEQRKREAYLRKKEKEDFKNERLRLREQLARDKAERAAGKGKLSSKLSVEGYKPDMLQFTDSSSIQANLTDSMLSTDQKQQPKSPKVNVSKIQEYIEKVSSYKAGGDGGKCLKILKIYVTNVVENPNEEKFKTIKMDNNAFKTKVKPFIGAKSLLVAVGFHADEKNENLIMSQESMDLEILKETKAKLEAALIAYG